MDGSTESLTITQKTAVYFHAQTKCHSFKPDLSASVVFSGSHIGPQCKSSWKKR